MQPHHFFAFSSTHQNWCGTGWYEPFYVDLVRGSWGHDPYPWFEVIAGPPEHYFTCMTHVFSRQFASCNSWIVMQLEDGGFRTEILMCFEIKWLEPSLMDQISTTKKPALQKDKYWLKYHGLMTPRICMTIFKVPSSKGQNLLNHRVLLPARGALKTVGAPVFLRQRTCGYHMNRK